MAVPEYQRLLFPMLRIAVDGKEHKISNLYDQLATEFQLTQQDLQELLPSGTQRRFFNRVHWAATYLRQAALLENPARGTVRITVRGNDLLKSGVQQLTKNDLMKFPEFVAFQQRTKGPTPPLEPEGIDPTAQKTPQELLAENYQLLRSALADELLEQVKACSPQFFEDLVVDLLLAMGYGGSRRDAGQAIGKSGDGGVDGVINEDRLGLDVVYIQAKRWKNNVQTPEVQAFAGSLEGFKARKGVMLTTSDFSAGAREYVSKIEKRIVLISGQELAQLMIDYGIGVIDVETYVVKRADLDYFTSA